MADLKPQLPHRSNGKRHANGLLKNLQAHPRKACIEGEHICRFLGNGRDTANLPTWVCFHPAGTQQEVEPHDASSVCGFGEGLKSTNRWRFWTSGDLQVFAEEIGRGRGWGKRVAARLGRSLQAVFNSRKRLLGSAVRYITAPQVLDESCRLFHEARLARVRLARFRREHGLNHENVRAAYWRRMRRGVKARAKRALGK